MIIANFKCTECDGIYPVGKESIVDDFPDTPCMYCKSKKTYRMWNLGDISIAEGNMGNASTGYNKSVTYHPSKYGHMKGTTIKKI